MALSVGFDSGGGIQSRDEADLCSLGAERERMAVFMAGPLHRAELHTFLVILGAAAGIPCRPLRHGLEWKKSPRGDGGCHVRTTRLAISTSAPLSCMGKFRPLPGFRIPKSKLVER